MELTYPGAITWQGPQWKNRGNTNSALGVVNG